MTKLIAFHGKQSIKDKYLRRVEAHRKADEIIQGSYGYWKAKNNGKGCAVGCTIHGSSHVAYETELGIPQIIARLEDCIFEGLAIEHAKRWPSAFLSNIQPGADLSMIWPKFAVWLLSDPQCGVFRLVKNDETKKAISGVEALYSEWISTGIKPDSKRWGVARAAAADDAAAAAVDAAYAAAAAAVDAAYAAVAAVDAAYAAVAAVAAAYARQARQNFWIHASNKLIELLKSA